MSASELPLTMQSDGAGYILVIDTNDWTGRVYRYDTSLGKCEKYTSRDDCPPLCRHQMDLQVRPALEVLQSWREKYRSLEWMVHPNGEDVVDGGWPGFFTEVCTYLLPWSSRE